MMREVVVDRNIVVHGVRRWDLEDGTKVPVNRQPPLLPKLALCWWWCFDLGRILDCLRRPEQAALSNSNNEQKWKIQDFDCRDVDLVEPTRAHDKLERDE
jgi:hypothetical protein